jgi:uncharacterized protein
LSWYIDSSAILKLIFIEKETAELDKAMKNRKMIFVADDVLAQIESLTLEQKVLNFAEAFNEDVSLRTLDAIHVASALLISGSIDGMITYDKQMAKNAKKMGINVLSPGAKV